MKKNLDYYMNVPYDISIKMISEDLGGGYDASIPLLGEHRCRGYGETIEKAIGELEEVKEDLFQDYLSKGYEIKEPINKEHNKYIILSFLQKAKRMCKRRKFCRGCGYSYIHRIYKGRKIHWCLFRDSPKRWTIREINKRLKDRNNG